MNTEGDGSFGELSRDRLMVQSELRRHYTTIQLSTLTNPRNGGHNSPHGKAVVDRVWKESMTNIANLKKGSMSRTVQTRFFWMLQA